MRKFLLTTTIAAGFLALSSVSNAHAEAQNLQQKVDALEAKIAKLEKLLEERTSVPLKAKKLAGKASNIIVDEAHAEPVQSASTPTKKSSSGSKGSEARVYLNPAPKFETTDGKFKFALGGYVQEDVAFFSDDKNDHPDGTTLRRARINVEGTILDDWGYKFENDFANNSSKVTDAFVSYSGLKPVKLTAGQFKEPFSLETLTSGRYTTFIERASLAAFAPSRNIGFAASTNGDNWSATLGTFRGNSSNAATDDEGTAITARAHFAPIAEKDMSIHLGAAASHRTPDAPADSAKFESRAETNLASIKSVSTGTIKNVDSTNLFGLEAAGVWNSLSVQGEYVMADVNRQNGLADLSYNGWYTQASYFLTGETRNYDAAKGIFGKTKPKSNFSLKDGGLGAWEVAARHSNLDLNDSTLSGGRMKNNTIGLNWYPNEYFRFIADYIMVDTDNSATVSNDDPDVFTMRAQVDF